MAATAPALFGLRYADTDLQRAIVALGDRSAKAVARALNRSAVSTRTVMQRLVRDDVKLKSRDVGDQMRVEKARPTQDGLQARVIISGARIPLFDFGARQTARGVSANTGGGRKVYKGSFIATMKSGHKGVFERKTRGKGSKRLPIIEKFGPSLPHVFMKHIPAGLVAGEASMQKNLAHEISYALKQSST